jgi:ABC-type sugar transport system ATPase subunit
MDPTLLSATGLSVRYGATVALDGVDLDLRRGEIHAIVGENGAGKSTLLRVLAGAEASHGGRLALVPGARIAWVLQEAVLPGDLDATAWIFLGCELRGRFGGLRSRAMATAAAAALRTVGCHAPATARLADLTASQRKQVQLARALRAPLDLLLLDEPTAVLGAVDAARLLDLARQLAHGGACIVYVSHRLEEVIAVADRITVLRDGRRIATHAGDAVDARELVRGMVGREVAALDRRADESHPGDEILRVNDLGVGHVHGVTLTVHAGEIVGLAGLVGSGRSAILEGLAGLRPLRSGTMHHLDTPILVPEDRLRKGLVPTLSLRENLFLPADGWRLRPGNERRRGAEWIARLGIRSSGSEAAVDSLSGGNQQKLLLARALRRRSRLMLLDEPTAGVDVAVKAEIHAAIRGLASAGSGVLLASSDLPELLALCHRIVVLHRGRCVDIIGGVEASEERIAGLMTGAPDVAGADRPAPSATI